MTTQEERRGDNGRRATIDRRQNGSSMISQYANFSGPETFLKIVVKNLQPNHDCSAASSYASVTIAENGGSSEDSCGG